MDHRAEREREPSEVQEAKEGRGRGASGTERQLSDEPLCLAFRYLDGSGGGTVK